MIYIFSGIGCPWLYQRPMNLILLFESIEVFKYDVWCRDRPLKEVFPDLYNISRTRDASVSEVLCYANGRIFWD